MKKLLSVFLISIGMFLFAATVAGAGVLDEDLDQKTIRKMLEYGQLFNMIYDEKGEMSHRMCAVLVDTGPDLVWKVITDFKNYDKFVPEMEPPVLRNKKEDEITVDFTLKIKIVGPIGSTQKYSTRYVRAKPYLYMYDPEDASAEPGYWKIVPVDDGKRTMLFYYDKAPDLMKMGKLVSGVVSTKPELALALQVSPISILLNETKAYAEKLAKK